MDKTKGGWDQGWEMVVAGVRENGGEKKETATSEQQ